MFDKLQEAADLLGEVEAALIHLCDTLTNTPKDRKIDKPHLPRCGQPIKKENEWSTQRWCLKPASMKEFGMCFMHFKGALGHMFRHKDGQDWDKVTCLYCSLITWSDIGYSDPIYRSICPGRVHKRYHLTGEIKYETKKD